MPLIGSQNLLDLPTFNGKVPNDGPRTIPVTADFSVSSVWTLDLSLQTKLKIVGFLQCVFIDNKDSDAPLYIRTSGIRQTVCIPGRSQAYVPLLLSDSPTVELESASGAPMIMHFLNVPMPLHVWSTLTQPALTVDGNGALVVSMPAFDALVSDTGVGPGLDVNVISGGGGGGGGGLRLPADYRALTGDISSTINTNIIVGSPRFYVNAIRLSLSPNAFITPLQVVTVAVKRGATNLIQRTFYPATGIPAGGAGAPFMPALIYEATGLDYWSSVDGENLAIQLTATLSGASPGGMQYTIWGGSGAIP